LKTEAGELRFVVWAKELQGGFKEVIFLVSGEDVYGTLKFDGCSPCVQRVPQTETQGRVHISSDMVLPEAEEFDVQLI
jgi:peptide chain release factor 1